MGRFGRNAEKGFALIPVLWGALMLSLVLSGLIVAERTAAKIERNSWQRFQARMIFDTAVTHAEILILQGGELYEWREAGDPVMIVVDGISVALTIEDERGKIDLNTTSRDELERYVSHVLGDPRLGRTIVDAIKARRAEFAKAGKTRRAEVPFQFVEQLRLLPMVSDTMFQALSPGLTVYAQAFRVDRRVAPSIVSAAFRPPGGGQNATAPGTRLSRLPLSGGRPFAIKASFVIGDRKFEFKSVIRSVVNSDRPFWTLRTTSP